MASAMVGRATFTANRFADISVSFVIFLNDASEEVCLSTIKCSILHTECKIQIPMGFKK
jgi:hypothetical protein